MCFGRVRQITKTGRNADVNIVGIDVEQGKELVETKDGEIVIATNRCYTMPRCL